MTFANNAIHGVCTGGIAAAVFFAAVAAAPKLAESRTKPAETSDICGAAAIRYERLQRIPGSLLQAIAAVESGRWDKAARANIAWPWTVTAKGKGRFYPDKRSAIRAVATLRQEGVTNIDVGCMQVNLAYHPNAFETLEEAFEPANNVAYAAAFLTELRVSRRSWSKAVKFYHSSDQARQRHYSKKVFIAQRAIRARDRRDLLEAQRRQRAANAAERSAAPIAKRHRVAGTIWPPRDYKAQRRMELGARVRAMAGRRR